ncbi:MAG: restriction endonuclease subunit S [Roseicyclus sp.]|uniref:restriction endonuclease subunit S n=1 Tax=Roseicyclus sp. TaxID=1914329 RepID=UPI003A83F399
MGWETRPLGDVAELVNGRAYKKSELLDSGPYRVLRVGNFFTNQHWYYSDLELPEKNYCESGDLLYAWSASFGPRIWSGEKCIFHYHIWKVDFDETRVLRDFLFYYFEWDKDLIRMEQGAGATMVHVSKRSMEQRAVPLPPLAEQQRIVAVLDEAFEGLARARAHAEANLQNARELFEAIKSDILTEAQSVGTPVTLDDVTAIASSLVDPKEDEYADLPHLGAGNMITGSDELIDVKTAREEKLISGKYLFKGGTVLYSKIRPYLRKAARPDFDGLCSADVYPLTPKQDRLDRDFLFHLLLADDFTAYAIQGSDRAGMPKVNRRHLFAYTFSLPPLDAQRRAAAKIDDAKRKCDMLLSSVQRKLEDMEELRQSLLQKAFAGELT